MIASTIFASLLFAAKFSHVTCQFDTELVAELATNLAGLGNTELNVISDFAAREQSRLAMQLNEMGTPSNIYDIAKLRYHQTHLPVEPCPIFGTGHGGGDDHGDDHGGGHGDDHGDGHGNEDAHAEDSHHDTSGDHSEEKHDDSKWGDQGKVMISHNSLNPHAPEVPYHRDDPVLHWREKLLPTQRFHKSLFIWLDQAPLDLMFTILDTTIMWCDQKIEVGEYNPQSRFYFLVQNRSMVDLLFTHEKLTQHAKVVAIYPSDTGNPEFVFADYWIFDGTVHETFVWKPTKLVTRTEDIFLNLKNFEGYHMRIATNPWSHHVLGDTIPEEEGGNATMKYRNYWGYEIYLLKEVSKLLNFTYTIVNPEDGKWGHIEADGTWSGLVFEAAIGRVDFVICDMFIVYSRQQVKQKMEKAYKLQFNFFAGL